MLGTGGSTNNNLWGSFQVKAIKHISRGTLHLLDIHFSERPCVFNEVISVFQLPLNLKASLKAGSSCLFLHFWRMRLGEPRPGTKFRPHKYLPGPAPSKVFPANSKEHVTHLTFPSPRMDVMHLSC